MYLMKSNATLFLRSLRKMSDLKSCLSCYRDSYLTNIKYSQEISIRFIRQHSFSLLQWPRALAGRNAKSSFLYYSLPFLIYRLFTGSLFRFISFSTGFLYRFQCSFTNSLHRFPCFLQLPFFDFHVIYSKLKTSPHEIYMSFAYIPLDVIIIM